MKYSKLSNGHLVPCILPIGSLYNTQWGERPVVAHVIIPLSAVRMMPTTEWGEVV